ncbi:ergothioneine biosynthesis protein EgtB [Granulicella sp. dw_53]|uniref:ergothioneine biosynthesis protein EgtB n=1 Tax=Granulicella sp. dw_53 TaxID=2719792 RepID=UPI001BD62B3D|nr:ergothioneine biosynthesis protein EgtB [Granulicella sp. dw_53]
MTPIAETLASSTPAAISLLDRFQSVRAATLNFCRPLSPEDLMVQSSPEASPVKWHLAHTSWFFETFVLREFVAAYQPFHPDFQWLFNSYYNSLGDMPEKKLRASFSRPPLDAILAYRTHVDTAIARLLEHPIEDEAARRIGLGLEHEQQHLELIATDVKHALFTNPLHPAYLEAPPLTASNLPAPPQDWVAFPGGLTRIGVTPDPADLNTFAFDNETPQHQVFLAPYSLATRLVTCAEYLAFIEEGGYTRPELWLSEGWTTIRNEGWQAPLYWQRDNATESGWCVYTLHGFIPLSDLSETPVCHLSFFEADAYARWAGYRLPTEFEWEHAASQQPHHGNLLESNHLHPIPAASIPGLQQIYGDVWEWTQSGYTGYPGYKPLPGALGEYNGKFMSSQVVLRGGSCGTPTTHIRATYRNFFSPATRWQFSGLRLAQDNPDNPDNPGTT